MKIKILVFIALILTSCVSEMVATEEDQFEPTDQEVIIRGCKELKKRAENTDEVYC